MREHSPGYGATIYEVECVGDRAAFLDWLVIQPKVAIDTETTGLDWAAPDFKCRLLQVANATESWVIPAELVPLDIWLLLSSKRVYMHNAPYDYLVIYRSFPSAFVCVDTPRFGPITDTKILSHLIDPRSPLEGGIGHSLKGLSKALLDPDADRLERELKEYFKKDLKAKPVAAGWALVPTNHPTYVQYAGLDPIFTYRLGELLERKCLLAGYKDLVAFEHEVQRVTTDMMRRGMRLDVDYTTKLSDELLAKQTRAEAGAELLGCTNVNSPQQVADALVSHGWTPVKYSATGKPVVDREVLDELGAAGSPLALAVSEAKRAGKWRVSYVDAMLKGRDVHDRVHPSIRSLAARTARMSISDPPLQQLPADDSTIRRCLIADEGYEILSVDYKGIEMRVLAALAHVSKMEDAIRRGDDIHDFTAGMLFGPSFTPKERKLAKSGGFLKVYGGGADKLALTARVPLGIARSTIKAYDDLFPEVKAYSRKLAGEAKMTGHVKTLSGRILPVDAGREYTALNYMIQSTARDVLAQGLLDLDKRGLLGYLMLPIHDEVLCQIPADDPDDMRDLTEQITSGLTVPDFYGLPLDVDHELTGTAWHV